MSMFKKVFGLGLPLVATLAAASYASADDVVAYLEGIGAGLSAADCGHVSSSGKRAIIAAEAVGVSAEGLQIRTVSYQSGTSSTAAVGAAGVRHKARLISELMDTSTGEFAVGELCRTGWSSGFASNTSTGANIMKCMRSVSSSVNGGSCRTRMFSGYSLGIDN